MGTAFLVAPRWSAESLEHDAATAVESFRHEREREPLDQYPAHVDECLGTVEELIELTVDLTQLRERATEVVSTARVGVGVGYWVLLVIRAMTFLTNAIRSVSTFFAKLSATRA